MYPAWDRVVNRESHVGARNTDESFREKCGIAGADHNSVLAEALPEIYEAMK